MAASFAEKLAGRKFTPDVGCRMATLLRVVLGRTYSMMAFSGACLRQRPPLSDRRSSVAVRGALAPQVVILRRVGRRTTKGRLLAWCLPAGSLHCEEQRGASGG